MLVLEGGGDSDGASVYSPKESSSSSPTTENKYLLLARHCAKKWGSNDEKSSLLTPRSSESCGETVTSSLPGEARMASQRRQLGAETQEGGSSPGRWGWGGDSWQREHT